MSTELDPALVRMPDPEVRERPAAQLNGFLGLLISLAVLIGLVLTGAGTGNATLIVVGALLGLVGLRGLTSVAPGQATVLQLFGRYTGTVRTSGLRWVNPLSSRQRVSTRIRNHESAALKVNDADGNPIEIAAVVVWRVEDTARAVFEVDSFVAFVQTQTDTAIRHIATTYPYDGAGDGVLSLRENADEITHRLSTEIAARVEAAGVRIVESRLTHLAYAPEIAGAMLQRQQAGAVVAARTRIVDGAVGMVEMALDKLAEREVVHLDEERKAAMVSNLLVVLCGDRATQPVVNASSLYH
ncbi:MAG TPA: SPFH domain-containing protein [Pseudonocardia sp.]|jgi:regulator of protease activity HflC (stomatin/prohibitin superfamily)